MSIRRLLEATSVLVLSFALVPLRALAQQDTLAPMPLGRLVDIGGRKLHFHPSGAGSPTVVVENGASSFSIDWALVQDRVSKFTRVCTYDRAGFAWSDRGPEENTVEETVDDLHLLLRTAGVPPPYVLVGHSIGGMFVRAYQRRFPAEVAVLGDLPLVVLRRGLRSNPVLDQREADLARMSSRGRLIAVAQSDHHMHLYQPDLVVQAIREVVDSVRKGGR